MIIFAGYPAHDNVLVYDSVLVVHQDGSLSGLFQFRLRFFDRPWCSSRKRYVVCIDRGLRYLLKEDCTSIDGLDLMRWCGSSFLSLSLKSSTEEILWSGPEFSGSVFWLALVRFKISFTSIKSSWVFRTLVSYKYFLNICYHGQSGSLHIFYRLWYRASAIFLRDI